jgi:hypothetical protein
MNLDSCIILRMLEAVKMYNKWITVCDKCAKDIYAYKKLMVLVLRLLNAFLLDVLDHGREISDSA